MKAWHVICGDYPPILGGISHHCAILAAELAASGREVHVWSRIHEASPGPAAVTLHPLPDFSAAGRSILEAGLNRFPKPRQIFLQYTPQLYGQRSLNFGFARWMRKRGRSDAVTVHFHEVAYPWVRSPLQHNLLALGHRYMARLLIRGAQSVTTATDAWIPLLESLGAPRGSVRWLPNMSNIAPVPMNRSVNPIPLIGHFGTFNRWMQESLTPRIEEILQQSAYCVRLIGAGSAEYLQDRNWPRQRIEATGALPEEEVAKAIQQCDVMLQPYADGANARRTSLLAALALGVPVISHPGANTEKLFTQADCPIVLCEPAHTLESIAKLLADRDRYALLGQAYYERYFSTHYRMHLFDELERSPV